jgi:hypothetical protein
MKKNRQLFILLFVIILLANLPMLNKSKSSSEYFSPNSVPDDVWNQYFYIRTALTNPENLGGEEDQTFQPAIWGYAIASLALVDSNFTEEAKGQLRKIITILETKNLNSSEEIQNQKVRLSLLYNLYNQIFQDTTFYQKSEDLISNLYWEIKDRGKYYQNIDLFNSSSLISNPELHLSFAIYKDHNNEDLNSISQKWLAAIRKTTINKSDIETIENLNWNLIFLSGINKPLADSLFQRFNSIDKLIKKESEIKQGTLLVTTAARAVQNASDFTKLVRYIKKNAQQTYEGNHLHFDKLNLTENTLLLFAKVCRFQGLMQISNKDPLKKE